MIGVRHVEAHTRKRLSGQLGPRLKRSNQRYLVSARYCNGFPNLVSNIEVLSRSMQSIHSRSFLSIPASSGHKTVTPFQASEEPCLLRLRSTWNREQNRERTGSETGSRKTRTLCRATQTHNDSLHIISP